MNELGDFTCQIFTRTDVTSHLVKHYDLTQEILQTLHELTKSALMRHSHDNYISNELEFEEDWYYAKAIYDSSNTHYSEATAEPIDLYA